MNDLVLGNNNMPVDDDSSDLPVSAMQIEESRAGQQVQASLVIAKKFPRDETKAYANIMKACQRMSFAEVASYVYPRGGQSVTGPSIRMAEQLAKSWGNLDFGIRELEQKNGESIVEAFCWDLETNVRQTKLFSVKHERHTKTGVTKLRDPRDIYETVANNGARRVRACILGIIPGDIVDAAIAECEKTLASAGASEPILDRARRMVVAFQAEHGISQELIEKRLGHKIEAIVEAEMITLRKIFQSLKDGMAKRHDFFDVDAPKSDDAAARINEKFLKKPAAKKAEKTFDQVDDPIELEN